MLHPDGHAWDLGCCPARRISRSKPQPGPSRASIAQIRNFSVSGSPVLIPVRVVCFSRGCPGCDQINPGTAAAQQRCEIGVSVVHCLRILRSIVIAVASMSMKGN